MKQKPKITRKKCPDPSAYPDIPPTLVRQGITEYSSNLNPGEQVRIPTRTFFLLFEKEIMERCTSTDETSIDGNN
jgi:hypothetical protein